MHGPGSTAVRVRPRHVAVDGEVELERAWPVAVPAVGARDPTREAIAVDLRDGAWCEVEQHDICGRDVGGRSDRRLGVDLAAELLEQQGECVGDGARAAFGDGPPVTVAGRDDRPSDGGGQRTVQGHEGVGGDAAEQRPGLLGAPAASGHRRGQQRSEPEPGELHRVVGHVRDRAHEVIGELVEVSCRSFEGAPPAVAVGAEAAGGLVDRAPEETGVARVERVGAVDLRPAPPQPVPLQAQLAEVRRPDAHGVERRAVVVQDTGHGQLARAGAAADVRRALEDGDVDAVLRQPDRGGEPVRVRRRRRWRSSSHGLGQLGLAHRRRSAWCEGRLQVTCSGMGPSGSHGCCATVSATR